MAAGVSQLGQGGFALGISAGLFILPMGMMVGLVPFAWGALILGILLLGALGYLLNKFGVVG